MNEGFSFLCLVLLFLGNARAVADFANLPCRGGLHKFESPEPEEDETQVWIRQYLGENGISASVALKVGMAFKGFVKVLGEPTERYQGKGGDWARWHHNPGMIIDGVPVKKHVAPWIRVRIENGVVKELSADRN